MRYDNPKIIERIEKSKNSIVGYLSVTNNSGRKQESLNMIIRSFYEQNTRANVFGNVRLLADFLVLHVNVPGVAEDKGRSILSILNTQDGEFANIITTKKALKFGLNLL